MFTGIVAGQGRVRSIRQAVSGIQLDIDPLRAIPARCKIGDSIAVNGCCLTLSRKKGKILGFDLLKETWSRTSFSKLKVGVQVNLETSLTAQGLISGHFVTGHIDGTGIVRERRIKGADLWLRIHCSREILRWVVEKGSIAVDGVSLTVARPDRSGFGVWIIPHTQKITTLGWKSMGEPVNLECDILAKYAMKALKR